MILFVVVVGEERWKRGVVVIVVVTGRVGVVEVVAGGEGKVVVIVGEEVKREVK